jgi:hypothetical protein
VTGTASGLIRRRSPFTGESLSRARNSAGSGFLLPWVSQKEERSKC